MSVCICFLTEEIFARVGLLFDYCSDFHGLEVDAHDGRLMPKYKMTNTSLLW